jgi:hypothetical protein
MKVRQARFSQSVWIDGRMEVSVSTDLAHHRHLVMELSDGVLKIQTKSDIVYVPLTNIGSFNPVKEVQTNAIDAIPRSPMPARRGRPPKQASDSEMAESIDSDASEEDDR